MPVGGHLRTVSFGWVRLNVLWRLNIHVHYFGSSVERGVWATVKSYCQSAASAWKRPGAKATRVEACMAIAACVWFIVSYFKYRPHDRQTSQQNIYQYSQTAWVVVASSEHHAQTTLVRNRQRFSSWFGCEAYSAWMCSHGSYSDWRQTQTLLLFRGLCALTYPRSLAGQTLTQGESLVKFP